MSAVAVKFEYTLIPSTIGTDSTETRIDVTDLLNRLGQEGWELVVIDYGSWILKRAIAGGDG